MNLPCTLAMLFSCFQFPESNDQVFLENQLDLDGPAASILIQTLKPEDDGLERERRFLEWFQAGYWPQNLSRFKPVQVQEGGHHLTYWVMPDYLALGNDQDWVLTPLTWLAAKALAEYWEVLVPTSKMVDQIYQQSQRVHWPHAYPASDVMGSTAYFLNHNTWIQERSGIELVDHPLIAGHKKDLVASPRLLVKTKKLALYGWHNLGNGAAIQPLSLWHGQFYVDYSHGVRFVAPEAALDGQKVSLRSILLDPQLAPLISFEGAFDICEVLAYPCK